MRTAHDDVMDDLAALVAGEAGAISKHAEHLASCDECRDAKHEAAKLATLIGDAGADYVASPDLIDRVLAKAGPRVSDPSRPDSGPGGEAKREPKLAVEPKASEPKLDIKLRGITSARSKRKLWLVAGAAAALAAGVVGVAVMKQGDSAESSVVAGGPIGKVKTISRAASEQGDGIAIKEANGWRPLRVGEMVPSGAELRTDERTRVSLDLSDGSRMVLDHRTTVVFDSAEPRRMKLVAGRIAADVAHVEKRQASISTPAGRIDVVGTRFSVTAADQLTAVQVVRGSIVLTAANGSTEEVRAGEEGMIEGGKLSISAAPQLVKETQWSELEQPKAKQPDQTTSGLGALRAYKPGEKRDRDWNLALANHEVKVRISGPVARTEITETFRNDSDTTLEGVYQFPLPADAQIDSLQLDMENEPGGFITGAFLDKERAAKIWRGVIDKATPKIKNREPLIQHEIVWVPGPWKDPALLDWKRGGRFELRIYPIPAKGARTIKLAYTQVVTPRGPSRQYVYPLPHSTDGSTVADKMKVDVEVRGAQQGSVRAAGYELKTDPARADVNALTLEQGGFVPRGDLVVDYKPDSTAEVRAWTFAGGAAVGPDDKLAAKKNVGIDPKVVEAQKAVAADARPTAVVALSPKLPRWRESKARDYMIIIDGSQSMVGERFTRAGDFATTLVADLDRRDRWGAMVCDSECRTMGDLRAPSATAAGELKTWLAAQTPAGASDVVAALRAGSAELKDKQREKWVLYIGDGFASTGFRRVSDVEKAVASTAGDVHITTIGIGTDADSAVLAAAARGGGGSYLAWTPGQSVGTAAMAALESTFGTSLRDATVELPEGMTEVAAAGGAASEKATMTSLPTLRAGGEVLIAARINGDVAGDIVLRGKVAGQKFEQRYPVKLAVSTSSGNGFVPRLWASLAIDQLERQGKGDDRARIVALSQGYGVMSRETSLLVLESQAMFDAFGVDRSQPTATWTGEDEIDEVAATGTIAVPANTGPRGVGSGSMSGLKTAAPASAPRASRDDGDFQRSADSAAPMIGNEALGKKAPAREERRMPAGGRRMVIQMKKVWTKHAALGGFDGVTASITKAIADAQDALAKNPDSREKHRALVQALSYAGKLDEAREVANRWLDRDKLDPQALGYIADILGREGKRELALRTLAGLVDLDADRANLHERMINAYERSGRLSQACSHRIALVGLTVKEAAKRAGAAARCLRSLGRTDDADLVMKSLADDKARTEAEKLATVAPVEPRVTGDLVINGKWDNASDLDISLVAPDGSRVSWMGGRTDITVADSTARDREQLSVKRLKKGNYLIEISRGEAASSTARGSLDVSVLGQKKSLPFELTGERVVVGKIAITMSSHLEPVNPGDARWLQPGWNRNIRRPGGIPQLQID
jgi:ferric-dicitrate binding protein FerR (iron transport regulator)/tetratricopeptide (TPR) repeat protein